MRDAFSGIVNISMIVVFMVIVSGYLAFNVNYTKAFRVKNKIISSYEEFEGKCGARNDAAKCNEQILNYMKSVGYSANGLSITGADCQNGYCAIKTVNDHKQDTSTADREDTVTYRIVTQINIDIPILNKIMPGLKIFQVAGDTKAIVER